MSELDHDRVRRYYDTEYYGSSGDTAGIPWHMRRVADRLSDLAGKAVLDVACGTGEWLAELERRGARVAGIDISENALARCRERLPEADFRQGAAETLPFGDAEFDLVTCLGSLEHFLDQNAALSEMHRVARPDARFLILVPNSGFLTRRVGLYRGTQQTAIKEDVRSLSEWETLLASAGLRVDDRWRDLHMLNRSWIARGSWIGSVPRLLQAAALPLWPISWQYQVYFLCRSAAR